MYLVSLVASFNSRQDVIHAEFLTDTPNKQRQNEDVSESIDAVVAAACSELITSEGRANQVAIAHVVKQGVAITCGEKDSFGWLTGVIHTKHGKIVFG